MDWQKKEKEGKETFGEERGIGLKKKKGRTRICPEASIRDGSGERSCPNQGPPHDQKNPQLGSALRGEDPSDLKNVLYVFWKEGKKEKGKEGKQGGGEGGMDGGKEGDGL